MILRLIRFFVAAACALALSHVGGTALAGAVVGTYTDGDTTVTMTYLNTYRITADGANATVDAYDLSATDSAYPLIAYEFDIGNGNLEGIPSLDSPFQVWDTSGDQTVTKTDASAILSTSNDTYQADTHVMTTLNTVIWDQETNDASFANGPDYQIGVGSLDYVTGDIGGNVGYTMDVANVGIVRGTVVSAQLQTGGTEGNLSLFNLTFPSSPLRGDANGDGKVDINDLTIVLANYGQTGATWTQGEFTGDGTVDINDLTIVLANYGGTLGSSPPDAVPEPSTLLLAAAGLLGALRFAGRRR
jgi:hypothetical protein